MHPGASGSPERPDGRGQLLEQRAAPEPPSSSGDAQGLRSGRTADFSGRKKSFSGSRGCRPGGRRARQNKAHVLTYQPIGKYLFRQEYLFKILTRFTKVSKGVPTP